MKTILLFTFCFFAFVAQAQISLLDTITQKFDEVKQPSETEFQIGKWKSAASVVLAHSSFDEWRSNDFKYFQRININNYISIIYKQITAGTTSHLLWMCMYDDNSYYIFDDIIENINYQVVNVNDEGFAVVDSVTQKPIAQMPDVRLRTAFETLADSNCSDEAKDSAEVVVNTSLSMLCGNGLPFANEKLLLPRLYIVGDDAETPFRILTYTSVRNDLSNRCFGFITRKTSKGFSVEALNDNTENIKSPERVRCDSRKWYGAVYYDIIPCKFNRKTYYTLLGFKSNDGIVKTRVIDVAAVGDKKTTFGAPIFLHEKATYHRRIFAYTAEANMLIRHDARANTIVFDHLAPIDQLYVGEFRFYGPDGTYDTYINKKDGWHFMSDADMRNVK